MVVDASIVVVENVRRHLARRTDAPRRRIVAEAVHEVARPVAFSVLVIAVILVPLYALQGIEGKMFAPLASTMLIALLVSLAVALLVIPVLSELALTQAPEKEFALRAAVPRRLPGPPGAGGGAARPAPSGWPPPSWSARPRSSPLVGTEFMPALDEGAIAINVVRLPNASLQGSVEVARYLEKRLKAFPEVETVVSKTGRAEISEDPMGPEQTDVFVMLKPRRSFGRDRSRADLAEAMQRDLSQLPGLRFSFSQPIALRVNELISGVKSDLAVKVFGTDLALLKGFADRIAVAVGGVRGASDVKVEQVSGLSQYDVVIDREAAARHGISVGDVNDTIESAIAGKAATTLIEDQRRFAVVVRFPAGGPRRHRAHRAAPGRRARRRAGAALAARPHRARRGAGPGLPRERHPPGGGGGQHPGARPGRLRGRGAGAAERRSSGSCPRAPSSSWAASSRTSSGPCGPWRWWSPSPWSSSCCSSTWRSAPSATRCWCSSTSPSPWWAAWWRWWLFRMPVSVSAAVAFIVLLGIAVQNGVVLVAFLRQLRDQGRTAAEAVREGCDLRFRPLLMTALTSFIGHLPMLYAQGSGADIQKPLAVVVMGGLVTSTALTLLVLPALYLALAAWRERRAGRQAGQGDRDAGPPAEGSAPHPP